MKFSSSQIAKSTESIHFFSLATMKKSNITFAVMLFTPMYESIHIKLLISYTNLNSLEGGLGKMNEVYLMIFRTFLIYLLILVVFRFMGKREIGELSVFDLVVNIMIAEMAVMAIDRQNKDLLISIVPIGILLLIQMTMARYIIKK